MSSVPVKPLGREDIRKLEIALLLTALYSKETIEEMKGEERLTWIDSLYVAAAALAREKAGIPVSRIADELGVTDATIRRHLKGETKAGELIKIAYEKLKSEGFKLGLLESEYKEKFERIRNILNDVIKELKNINGTENIIKMIEKAIQELSNVYLRVS